MEKLLEFKNVYFSFTKHYNVLYNINFSLNLGEKAVIIANADSGITSFIRLILKDQKAQSGDIFLSNKHIQKISFKKDIFLAYLPQQMVFFENKSVYYNLNYFFKLHKVDNYSAFDICENLNINGNSLVKNLSYFEKVKLAIARFSCRRVQLLIIENVFENLSFDEGVEVLSRLENIIKQNNASTLLVVNENNEIIKKLDGFSKYLLKYSNLEKIR